MNELARRIIEVEGVQTAANGRPKDAATLVLIDQTCRPAAVLLGKRHRSHVFLPGKFVFPGGRVDKCDHYSPICCPIDRQVAAKLNKHLARPSKTIASALAVAAIRETFEETGVMIGTKSASMPTVSKAPWSEFAKHGFCVDLSRLHFIARAITPPHYPRRFDTRFFAVDSTAIVHQAKNVIHPDAELTELVWLPIPKALQINLPVITGLVLNELETRIGLGFSRGLPVPFYRMKHKRFVRELL